MITWLCNHITINSDCGKGLMSMGMPNGRTQGSVLGLTCSTYLLVTLRR